MPGMQTELNAVIIKPGVFHGLASHYSGAGFSGMTFKFHGLSNEEFDQWVAKAKSEGKALTRDTYLNLVKPSERNPVERFATVDEGLYDKVQVGIARQRSEEHTSELQSPDHLV